MHEKITSVKYRGKFYEQASVIAFSYLFDFIQYIDQFSLQHNLTG